MVARRIVMDSLVRPPWMTRREVNPRDVAANPASFGSSESRYRARTLETRARGMTTRSGRLLGMIFPICRVVCSTMRNSPVSLSSAGPEMQSEELTADGRAILRGFQVRSDRRRTDLIAERGLGLLQCGHLPDIIEIRRGNWNGAPPPPAYLGRRVEITGPSVRKLLIYGLNSSTRAFVPDFEDANAPRGGQPDSGAGEPD
jgi:Malate synthase